MSKLGEVSAAIDAIMAGRTLAGGAYYRATPEDSKQISSLVYDLYGVEHGDIEALKCAIGEQGDLMPRLKEACISSGVPFPPPDAATLLRAMDRYKVEFSRTAPGAPTKWTNELYQELLARVDQIKTAKSGSLSDEDALEEMISTNPESLKTFCKEQTWGTLLNSKGKLKSGADITPVVNTLKNQLSKARHRFE
jgi:hypothetical protein